MRQPSDRSSLWVSGHVDPQAALCREKQWCQHQSFPKAGEEQLPTPAWGSH